MGRITEVEILDCLKSNLRLAAQNCDTLAKSARKGPAYKKLRDHLRLVEGSCRQIAYLRGGDARWLKIGMYMGECHKRAGDWLRGTPIPGSKLRVSLRPGEIHPLFTKLAANLRAAYDKAEELRTKRTNRIGPILPRPGEPPHRDTRPVGYRRSPAGLFVPLESRLNGG